MAIRRRIVWRRSESLADPALRDLDQAVRAIRRHQGWPHWVRRPRTDNTFENREGYLPLKPHGYYKEYIVVRPGTSGTGLLRLVLGHRGETYLSGNHYADFRQIIDLPA